MGDLLACVLEPFLEVCLGFLVDGVCALGWRAFVPRVLTHGSAFAVLKDVVEDEEEFDYEFLVSVLQQRKLSLLKKVCPDMDTPTPSWAAVQFSVVWGAMIVDVAHTGSRTLRPKQVPKKSLWAVSSASFCTAMRPAM